LRVLILLFVLIQLRSPDAEWNGIRSSGCSALALLVTRVALADDHDAAVTANHLAVVADGLDAGIDLHDFLFAVFAGQA
jgi:hypothetical protein